MSADDLQALLLDSSAALHSSLTAEGPSHSLGLLLAKRQLFSLTLNATCAF